VISRWTAICRTIRTTSKAARAARHGYESSPLAQEQADKEFGRKLPSRIANWLISSISGVRLHDYGCSLKAYRRDVLRDVKLYGEMHRFIPIYASWQGARVSEMGQPPVAPRRTLQVWLSRTFKWCWT